MEALIKAERLTSDAFGCMSLVTSLEDCVAANSLGEQSEKI